MFHLFIVNPAAGMYDHTAEVGEKVMALMSRHDRGGKQHLFSVERTERPGHATELVRARAEAHDRLRVYACGGDGTLHEVVNGAAGLSHVDVTQYPCGSGNDFVRTFGLERFLDFEALMEGKSRSIDLIDCGGFYSINICSFGFDARVVKESNRGIKRLPLLGGASAYYAAVVKAFLKGIHRRCHVSVDGQEFEGEFTLFTAANGRYYGGGFNPTPDALPDDGLLDFLLVKGVSRAAFLKLIKKYEKGRYAELSDVITFIRGKRMEVTCESGDVANYDGEVMDARGAVFAVADKRINFVVPEP